MINRRERDARSGDAQTGTTQHRLQHDLIATHGQHRTMHDLWHIHLAIRPHPNHLLAGIPAGTLRIGPQHDGLRNVPDVERRLLRIILGIRRLLRVRFHDFLRACQRLRIRHILGHRIGELDTLLTMLLEAGDGGQNRTLRLRDIHSTGREGTTVAKVFHVEQQILMNIAGRYEIAMNRIGQS